MGELEIVPYNDALDNMEWQVWANGSKIATFYTEKDAKEYCETGGSILMLENDATRLRDALRGLRELAEAIERVEFDYFKQAVIAAAEAEGSGT